MRHGAAIASSFLRINIGGRVRLGRGSIRILPAYSHLQSAPTS
jgi:hypothetical protein